MSAARFSRWFALVCVVLIGTRIGTSEAAGNSDASAHVSRARQLFQEQQYSEAADELQRAYVIDPKPLFLFNAGQAYRKAGKRQEALDNYQRYIDVAPDGPLLPEARSNVADLKSLIQAEENLKDVSLRLETERTQLESEKKKAEEMEQALRKERQKPWYKRTPFIVVATTAGSVLVVGLVILGGLELAGRTTGGTVAVTF